LRLAAWCSLSSETEGAGRDTPAPIKKPNQQNFAKRRVKPTFSKSYFKLKKVLRQLEATKTLEVYT